MRTQKYVKIITIGYFAYLISCQAKIQNISAKFLQTYCPIEVSYAYLSPLSATFSFLRVRWLF